MFLGDYERFVHKPVERKPAPAPVVRRALVRPAVRVPTPRPKLGRSGAWPKLAELYAANPDGSLGVIARQAGIHRTTAYYALVAMGLYVRRDSDEAVAKRMQARMTPGHVSQKTAARERADALRAAGRSPHWAAKLTDQAVRTMRDMAAHSIPRYHIAEIFEVDYSTAKSAIAGDTWKHVQ